MRIVKVAGHACPRVQKEALALLKNHEVHLIAGKRPQFHEAYTTYSLAGSIDQFMNAIKLYDHIADVFHVHNEPSWFVSLIKSVSAKPIILDVHDSYTARLTAKECFEQREAGKKVWRKYSEERNNFELADGLVFPGGEFQKIVCEAYSLTQPYIILPSYVPKILYRYDAVEWWGGLVYEGRVDTAESVESDDRFAGFKYCDYEAFAVEAQSLGLQFHVYTTKNDDAFKKIYEDICFLHEPEPLDKLVKHLTRHDWGLVGNVTPTEEWRVAFPNKLFEYVAAGIPIVAINAHECAKFITQHDIGIVVKSLAELKDRWNEHKRCRHNVARLRNQFTMDANINVLEELYERAT